MKTYIKLAVLALCATIAVSLSAQTAPFSNEMPSQWAQNKPIEKKAQRYVAPQQYQSPTLGKGSNYNAVTTETARRANTPTSATLQQNNGNNLKAPAQRLRDFVYGHTSETLPSCSYLPGIMSSPLHKWLPPHIRKRLQDAFKQFDRKMKGYLTNDAIIVGVESRSSSPVRIPRDNDTFEHIEIKGLYPCGEGAGYAGGITSSAMDGINAAQKIIDII